MTHSTGAPARETIGRYRLLHEIASGRNGSALAAEDPDTRRRVVVHLLPPRKADRDGFLDDARRLTRLGHDHLATLVDCGRDPDLGGYLVAEFYKGETLQDRLKREHRLPLKEAVRIAREIAAALAYLHAQEIVHRELCPANVWLEPSGRVRVLGLGVAPAAADLLVRLDESGAPGYMSPEQASGESVGPASDLFSLGCLLYQMATGEQPFRGEASSALCRAVIFDHPVSAGRVCPDVPDSIDELIAKLMAKMASDRPASAADVEASLRDWLDPLLPKGRPDRIPDAIELPPSTRILETLEALKAAPPAIAPIRRVDLLRSPVDAETKLRRGWLADVLAAVLLIAGGAGLYWWWKASNDRPPAPAAVKQAPADKGTR